MTEMTFDKVAQKFSLPPGKQTCTVPGPGVRFGKIGLAGFGQVVGSLSLFGQIHALTVVYISIKLMK